MKKYKIIDQCCVWQSGRKWLCLILIILMQTMLCLNLKSASGPDVPQRPGIMGDFARVIRQTNGHIDTAATISRLQTANIKSYMYLIAGSNSAMDWTDFCSEFMPAAQNAGIDVFVYLVPPTEGGPSAPHNTTGTPQDYVNWADDIATVAQSYSRLKGIVMDDFVLNLITFTPAVVDDMMAAAHAACPRLSFHVIAYFFSETHEYYGYYVQDKFIFDYADHIDGIIFPYRDLDDSADLNHEITSIKEMINNVTGHYSISFPANTLSDAYDYGRISQTVSVPAGLTECKISFNHFGSKLYTLQGYHFKRFLIDGVLVWSEDMAAAGSQRGKVDLDITSYLTGKTSVVLSFELYEQQGVYNYSASVNFSKLTATNVTVHDFSETAYWIYSEKNTSFSGVYNAFTPAHGTTSLPLTTMIYAWGTSWHAAEPASAYLIPAFDIAGKAVKDGNADGFVTYCLDKNSVAGTNYLAAKAAFFNYKDLFYRAGHWWLDEGSGSAACDSSIFANDGTISNASWDNSDSKSGSSLSFNRSSNSSVSVTNDPSLQLTDDLTLSLWIKPGNLASRQSLLDKRYWGEFALTLETDGRVSYYHGHAQATDGYYGVYIFPAGTVTTGAWQHIVVTRNAATRTITSYYNGIQKGSWIYSSSLLPTVSLNNVLIGNGYAGGFTGKIDQPVIYSRALSGGEVFRQYLDGDSRGNWGFDEAYGPTAFDSSFYTNDGILSNASWDNSDSKSGSSLSFNRSSNSVVNIASDTSLQLTGNLTLSLWIKPSNFTYRQNLLDKRYYGEFSLTMFETTGKLYYFHGSATNNYFTFTALDTGTIQSGVWQHIVITRDAVTRTVKSYYNGVYKKTSLIYSTDQLPTSSTDLLKIGNGYAGGFNGKIDEVKIYNKALSETEVTNLYNSYQ